jgi:CRISPR-associated protein Cmr3
LDFRTFFGLANKGKEFSFESIEATGLKTLAIDIRTHVKIDSTSASSEDGKLFQTASLDLNHQLQGTTDCR